MTGDGTTAPARRPPTHHECRTHAIARADSGLRGDQLLPIRKANEENRAEGQRLRTPIASSTTSAARDRLILFPSSGISATGWPALSVAVALTAL
jgi:hypothetical protein